MGKQQIEWVIDDVKNTIIDRGKERDLEDGERTIPRCVTAFNSISGHKLSNEDGWLFMQCLKMCRSVQGSYKYDDYRDGVGYAALRAEEARMTEEKRHNLATTKLTKLTEQKTCEHGNLQPKGSLWPCLCVGLAADVGDNRDDK